MSTLLNYARDVQGYNTEAPDFSTDIFTATLAADTEDSIVIPANYAVWMMSVKVQPGGWVWVSRTGTAADPGGGTFADSISELAPGTLEFKRRVYAGDTISFISHNTTCDVAVSLFALSSP